MDDKSTEITSDNLLVLLVSTLKRIKENSITTEELINSVLGHEMRRKIRSFSAASFNSIEFKILKSFIDICLSNLGVLRSNEALFLLRKIFTNENLLASTNNDTFSKTYYAENIENKAWKQGDLVSIYLPYRFLMFKHYIYPGIVDFGNLAVLTPETLIPLSNKNAIFLPDFEVLSKKRAWTRSLKKFSLVNCKERNRTFIATVTSNSVISLKTPTHTIESNILERMSMSKCRVGFRLYPEKIKNSGFEATMRKKTWIGKKLDKDLNNISYFGDSQAQDEFISASISRIDKYVKILQSNVQLPPEEFFTQDFLTPFDNKNMKNVVIPRIFNHSSYDKVFYNDNYFHLLKYFVDSNGFELIFKSLEHSISIDTKRLVYVLDIFMKTYLVLHKDFTSDFSKKLEFLILDITTQLSQHKMILNSLDLNLLGQHINNYHTFLGWKKFREYKLLGFKLNILTKSSDI